MQISDLPEEDQESKPKSNEIPQASELKQKSKVVNRGKVTIHTGEKDMEPTSKPEEKTSSRPTTRSRLHALVSSWPDRPTETSPASPLQAESQSESSFPTSDLATPQHAGEEDNPGRRLHAFEAAAKNASPAKVPWQYRLRPNRELTHRAYWDVAATFSLIVNTILISLLLIMAGQIRNLKTTVNDLLGGLYGNFVKMDQASLITTVVVNAQIPFDFKLPLSQNTEVILTQDVSIPGAHVVINTGSFNINAPANVTLPAGTNLPIAVNLEIPIQTTIPISLQVPINIPLNQTGLHESFAGLQTTLRPLYCDFNKNAQYPEGTFICAEHDAATPGTP
jgi:hypothetical protein